MRVETFLEKFELFAGAPGAVERVRELVLQLAVMGRLVDQESEDASAYVLLYEINDERLAAISAGNVNASDPLPPLEADELRFDLPCGWAPARLRDLVLDIQTGPFGSSLHKSDYQLGGTPVINPASLKAGKIVPIREMAVGRGTVKRLEVFKLRRGDIVMARRGEMGRCAIVTDAENGWLCGTGSLVLRMPLALDARYLAMFIGSPMARSFLGGVSVGTTMQNLNQAILSGMPLGVPPLAEQKRIVAKVDELMALCDQLEAQQKEQETKHVALTRASLARFAEAPTPANLQLIFHPAYTVSPADLRKTILTLAVQGKLVPQEPNDDPSEVLLGTIDRRKSKMLAAGQLRVKKVSRPTETKTTPRQAVPGWSWVSLDALCYKITDGTHFTPHYTSSGVRFVSAKDIATGRLLFERCKYIAQEEHDRLYRRCNPQYHDILLSKSGSIGTVALVEDRDEFSLFESLALLKFDQDCLCPEYLKHALTYLCSSLTPSHIRGVGVKHLHLDILRGLELGLPPLAEQRRIVAKVNELMSLVDTLESQLASARDTAATLLDAAIAELTNDEKRLATADA